MKIIEDCKYAIHDISRTDLDAKNKLPRFNMPLELGIFIGCKKYLDADKSYIIFDKTEYRYQKFISDIAGQDIRAHQNKPSIAVNKTRDYLRNVSRRTTIPSGNAIYTRFKKFNRNLPAICKQLNWDDKNLNFMDYYYCIKAWLDVKT